MGFIEPNRYEPAAGWRETLAKWVESPPGGKKSWQYQIGLYWRWRTLDGMSLREAWKKLRMKPATALSALDPNSTDSGRIPWELFSRVLARSQAEKIILKDDVADVVIAETPSTELPDKPEVGFTPARLDPPRPALYQPRAGWKDKLVNAPPNSTGWLADLHLYWRKRTEEDKPMEQAWEELEMDSTPAGTSLERNLWDRGSIPPELIGRVVARSQNKTEPVEGIILYPELTV